MSCSLCQSATGHKDRCPTIDPRYTVDWRTDIDSTAWEAFARELFDVWQNDSLSETKPEARKAWSEMGSAFQTGDVRHATDVLRKFVRDMNIGT